jgi:hypothetical protein
MMMRGCIASAMLFLVLPVCAASSGSADGNGVRVLYAGASRTSPSLLTNDPFFEATTIIPASLYFYPKEIIQRAVRVYMPRTFDNLITKYDVISLSYADHYAFKPEYHKWFTDAVLLEGKGLFLSHHDFAGTTNLQEWTQSSVGLAVPVKNTQTATIEPCRIRVLAMENPLMTSLPWSTIGIHGDFAGYTRANVKEGGEALAELVTASGRTAPFLVWWDVGVGRSLVLLTYYSSSEDPFRRWEYLDDFIIDYYLYVAKREIPPDPEIVHEIRLALTEYNFFRSDLVSMMEFISKIGGNPASLNKMLNDANSQRTEIDKFYMNYDFDRSLELAHDLVEDLEKAHILGLKEKNRTFYWIYVAEWLTLMATSIVAGFMVWSLMVEKRIYRETQTNRLNRTA